MEGKVCLFKKKIKAEEGGCQFLCIVLHCSSLSGSQLSSKPLVFLTQCSLDQFRCWL